MTINTTRRSLGKCLIEAAGGHRDVVYEHRIDDDPHHRPEGEHGAIGGGGERDVGRQAPDRHGDDETNDESCQRGLPRRAFHYSEKNQDRRDGQYRNQE
jgi:hypothetical protein